MGRLQVRECRDPTANRWLRVAELHTHDLVELLPPLRDVTLLQLQGHYMVLAGYEHRYVVGDDQPAVVGQAWAVHGIDAAAYHAWHAGQIAEGRLSHGASAARE
ncbi:MAG: hypothetical protein ACK4XK_10610 [Casimicrobiaceae bacterium]